MRTASPRCSSSLTSCSPINPEAPVIRITWEASNAAIPLAATYGRGEQKPFRFAHFPQGIRHDANEIPSKSPRLSAAKGEPHLKSPAITDLILFHNVLQDEVGQSFALYRTAPTAQAYNRLARALWAEGANLQDHLLNRLLADENPFTQGAEKGELSPELIQAARWDLTLLGEAARSLTVQPVPLPPPDPTVTGIRARFRTEADWAEQIDELAAHLRANGTGQMGRYHALRWESGQLFGIEEPDPIRMEELVGSTEAKAIVMRNTEQFLQGLPANNLLLYGDRGTGKSSTVKALVHRYGPQGLRIVELGRADLDQVAAVMRAVRSKAQRFILFIDDLSFEEFEVSYKTFKAVLEGSLERRPSNLLVYATSNRQHLIRQRWSDREPAASDEVHPGDTLQERTSLADRFGITVLFTTPDQEQFLFIVQSLAAQKNLPVEPEELRRQAIQWTLWHHSRNGRTARQFVDDLAGRLGMK
jgi:predicted AAA+ superfamily ATPase